LKWLLVVIWVCVAITAYAAALGDWRYIPLIARWEFCQVFDVCGPDE